MVSKSQIKLITALEQKKYREKYGLFAVEGKKGINEILKSNFVLHSLYTTSDIFEAARDKSFIISEAELIKISKLKTPQTALAIFEIPSSKPVNFDDLVVALDGIRDPGNLGTIIRLCDWFGIKELLCSNDTVDCYNPKVVQATMGSITRVNITYGELDFVVQESQQEIFGAFLEGENVYTATLPGKGILVLGNEANGITNNMERLVSKKIHIPQFGQRLETESLNVATATAILLSEFKRRTITGK